MSCDTIRKIYRDELVKLSASDPTAGYLDAKLNEGVTGVKAQDSAGFHIKGSGGSTAALFGAGGGQNVTFYDGVKLDALTGSKVLFTDANKNITTTGIGTSSQFIKGDGSLDSSTYLTAEADTLQTVTDRGATTTNDITIGSVDLALNKTTDKSSQYGSNSSNLGNDGDPTTFFLSNNVLNDWWKVDLGAVYAITKIIYIKQPNTTGAQRPKAYKIQSSADWAFTSPVDLVTKTNDTEASQTFSVSTSTRYLRVYCTAQEYLSVAAFMVYGTNNNLTAIGDVKVNTLTGYGNQTIYGDTRQYGNFQISDYIYSMIGFSMRNPSSGTDTFPATAIQPGDMDIRYLSGALYGGMWLGQGTPNASNYSFLGSGADTNVTGSPATIFFNAPGASGIAFFRQNNLTLMQIRNSQISVVKTNENNTSYGSTNALFTINANGASGATTDINLSLKARTSQTGALTQWLDPSDNVLGKFTAGGVLQAPKLSPIADSTTAMQFFKADGTTAVMTIDTTNARVGIGTTAPSAKLHVLSTTEQLRLGYDASNYFSTTVASTGSTTFALTGTTPTFTFSQGVTFSGGITIADAKDIALNTTTGTKIGTATTQKLSFWNKTPVVQPTALTTKLTQITHDEPGTPDYAIQALTQTTPYGFVTADEAQTLLKVIKNLQVRVDELETKLTAVGLLA